MIAVLGAGAFGSALAIAIGGDVALWGRGVAPGATASPRLPDHPFPPTVHIKASLEEAVLGADAILLAVPMSALAETAAKLPAGDAPVIACCKGINPQTGKGPVSTLAELLNRPVGILTGPSFATDIAAGKPTALTLSVTDGAEALQARLSGRTLRLYRSEDLRGLELGGALKNVLAIAAGAVAGAGLGQSAQAALMTRGLNEILALSEIMGAKRDTLLGLSGIGDLMLTAFSPESRNYRYGVALGQGANFPGGTTVEGIATARAVAMLAQEHGVELPVLAITHRLISKELTIEAAVDALMTRPLKEE